MLVTRISRNSISTLSLPRKKNGQYWIYSDNVSEQDKLLGIEGVDDRWILRPTRKLEFVNAGGSSVKSVELEPMNIYAFKDKDNELVSILTEPVTDDRQVFVKYLAKGDTDLVIGRYDDCDIFFPKEYVSSHHAVLSLHDGKWSVKDLDSTNGTFVNEKRVSEKQLSYGDVVYIMGLKIVVGKNFAAFNDPDGMVRITEKLVKYISQSPSVRDDDDAYELH